MSQSEIDPQARPEPSFPPAPYGLAATALQVVGAVGFGLWLLLGMALALGIYSDGRGEVLVPLLLGTAFIVTGLAAACLRLRSVPDWLGWTPGRSYWPGREALIALATFLPMLAVAGLARGANDFWATRLAAAVLMLCSLASLVYAGQAYSQHLQLANHRISAQVPAGRVVSALYGGGLWLWLCVDAQDDVTLATGPQPWTLALLMAALVLGLVEGSRWQTMDRDDLLAFPKDVELWQRKRSFEPRRLLAALLAYGVPCVVLLWTNFFRGSLILAAVAAVAYLVGRSIEQQLYGDALLRWKSHQRDES